MSTSLFLFLELLMKAPLTKVQAQMKKWTKTSSAATGIKKKKKNHTSKNVKEIHKYKCHIACTSLHVYMYFVYICMSTCTFYTRVHVSVHVLYIHVYVLLTNVIKE